MADKILVFEGLRLTNNQLDALRSARHGVLLDTYLQNGTRRRTYDCLVRHGLLERRDTGVFLRLTERGVRALNTVSYTGSGFSHTVATLRYMQPCERRLLHVFVAECIVHNCKCCDLARNWKLSQAQKLRIPKEYVDRVSKFVPEYMDAYKLG
jgi:hypothetical protein